MHNVKLDYNNKKSVVNTHFFIGCESIFWNVMFTQSKLCIDKKKRQTYKFSYLNLKPTDIFALIGWND